MSKIYVSLEPAPPKGGCLRRGASADVPHKSGRIHRPHLESTAGLATYCTPRVPKRIANSQRIANSRYVLNSRAVDLWKKWPLELPHEHLWKRSPCRVGRCVPTGFKSREWIHALSSSSNLFAAFNLFPPIEYSRLGLPSGRFMGSCKVKASLRVWFFEGTLFGLDLKTKQGQQAILGVPYFEMGPISCEFNNHLKLLAHPKFMLLPPHQLGLRGAAGTRLGQVLTEVIPRQSPRHFSRPRREVRRKETKTRLGMGVSFFFGTRMGTPPSPPPPTGRKTKNEKMLVLLLAPL